MDAQNTLTVYRSFESCVLDHLDEVFTEADGILHESGVVATPIVEKPKRPEPKPAATTASQSHDWNNSFDTVEEVVEDLDINLDLEVENSTHAAESTNTFSMMQNLMHGDSPAAPAPGNAAPGGTTAPIGAASEGGIFIPEGHVVVPANQAQQYQAQPYQAQQQPAPRCHGVLLDLLGGAHLLQEHGGVLQVGEVKLTEEALRTFHLQLPRGIGFSEDATQQLSLDLDSLNWSPLRVHNAKPQGRERFEHDSDLADAGGDLQRI